MRPRAPRSSLAPVLLLLLLLLLLLPLPLSLSSATRARSTVSRLLEPAAPATPKLTTATRPRAPRSSLAPVLLLLLPPLPLSLSSATCARSTVSRLLAPASTLPWLTSFRPRSPRQLSSSPHLDGCRCGVAVALWPPKPRRRPWLGLVWSCCA